MKHIPWPAFMKIIRMCLSGKKQGPSVADMIVMLGTQEVLERLEAGRMIFTWEMTFSWLCKTSQELKHEVWKLLPKSVALENVEVLWWHHVPHWNAWLDGKQSIVLTYLHSVPYHTVMYCFLLRTCLLHSPFGGNRWNISLCFLPLRFMQHMAVQIRAIYLLWLVVQWKMWKYRKKDHKMWLKQYSVEPGTSYM